MSEYIPRLTGSLPDGIVHRVQVVDEKIEGKKETLQTHSHTTRPRKTRRTFLQKGPVAAVLLTVTTFIALAWLRSLLPGPQHYEVPVATPSKFLQLAIPINRLYDVDLCKTVVSAQVLNYPVPVIVPWGNSSDETPVPKEKRIYHKVARTYAYLSTLPPEAEDAITILLDGPDTWFQLRPELLLQSYYRVIGRANRELEKTYGPGTQQKVIFSAYGECGSSDPADPACSAVPAPPSEGAPKHLGHGAMVGPAKDILAIVRRALNKLETTRNPPTKMLPVYSEIFGEQELQRQHRRSKQLPRRSGAKEARQPTQQPPIDVSAELGIGLDYNNELGFSISADEAPTWQKPKILLEELGASTPPYWTVSGLEPDLPHNTTWSDVELLTTNTSIPAMIHHYPTVAMGGKDPTGHRIDWWPDLWLAQHARTLYTASERLPSTVVAQVTDNEGHETLFWNRMPAHNKAGAWLPDFHFFHFHDMCGAEAQWGEVFRDDRGPWKKTDFF